MKYYLLVLFFSVISILTIIALPRLTTKTEDYLHLMQIPESSEVAGVQKYNLSPISLGLPEPTLSARAVLVKDLATGTIIYQKNVNVAVPIASTTKIMTALVSSEYFDPNSVLTVQQAASVAGSKVGLLPGESLNFRSLLYGMLLNSGNDAAFAIAENYPGGILSFVSAMNKKSQAMNLRNTHFENPAGLDHPKHYSSAADLASITEEALKDAQLLRIFATTDTEILSLDKKHVHKLHNLNKLLTSVTGVLGVKTGYTEEAKENLVTYVDRDDHKILTVVLGSDNRFGESTELIEWVYDNFVWR